MLVYSVYTIHPDSHTHTQAAASGSNFSAVVELFCSALLLDRAKNAFFCFDVIASSLIFTFFCCLFSYSFIQYIRTFDVLLIFSRAHVVLLVLLLWLWSYHLLFSRGRFSSTNLRSQYTHVVQCRDHVYMRLTCIWRILFYSFLSCCSAGTAIMWKMCII